MQICSIRPPRVRGVSLAAALLLSLAALPPAAAQPSPHAELLVPRPDSLRVHGQPRSTPQHLPRRDQLVEHGIYRLDGLDASLPQADLEPLRRILEGAQVVGLGETVHTSGGYYAMKHRLFRFLVEQMGFRAFAMETPWHWAQVTGRYVATCQGSVIDAMDYIFPVWASTETGALLEYMCTWNQQHPNDPITFFGFDTQQPEADGPALIDLLTGLGAPADDPRIAGIRRCNGVTSFTRPVTDSNHQACLETLDAVDRLLEEMDGSNAVQLSREDVEWAKIRAIGLRAWEDQAYYSTRLFRDSFNARDRGMATVLQRMRKLLVGSQKTAVWAHNFHLAKWTELYGPWQMMGAHLDRELGHRYASVALAASSVTVEWPWLYCGPEDAIPEWSAEWRLQPLGEPFLLVDLDMKGANPAHPPYLDPKEWWVVGRDEYLLDEQFDAFVYLEDSPGMTPVFWTPCN